MLVNVTLRRAFAIGKVNAFQTVFKQVGNFGCGDFGQGYFLVAGEGKVVVIVAGLPAADTVDIVVAGFEIEGKIKGAFCKGEL